MDKIIAINGKRGAGKNTTALCIKDWAERNGYKYFEFAFAKRLKYELALSIGDRLGFDESDLYNDNKKDYRLLLQWFGDYKRKKNKDYWVDWLKEDLLYALNTNGSKILVITDLRLKNEYEFLSGFDCILLRVLGREKVIDNHSSEVELDDFPFDYEIDNDNLEELQSKVDEFMESL